MVWFSCLSFVCCCFFLNFVCNKALQKTGGLVSLLSWCCLLFLNKGLCVCLGFVSFFGSNWCLKNVGSMVFYGFILHAVPEIQPFCFFGTGKPALFS